jgi:hypothetical protein
VFSVVCLIGVLSECKEGRLNSTTDHR